MKPKDDPNIGDIILDVLELVLEQKSRPSEMTAWQNTWFEAHSIFAYETFLYVVATLIKAGADKKLNQIFTSKFLAPETERGGGETFVDFGNFQSNGYSIGDVVTAPEGRRYKSAVAELIRRSSDRKDISFQSLIEADLLCLLMAFLGYAEHWYPRTLFYADSYRGYPLFVRAMQKRGFRRIATISGIDDPKVLLAKAEEGSRRLGADKWYDFSFTRDFIGMMKLRELNSVP